MNGTILIVDDMKVNINMLTNILRNNYTIMAAVSGENAMKLLEVRVPDLVLLDIYMPGVDGFKVLEYMKSRKELSNIPVIFVTGAQDNLLEEKGLALGAVDYIKKPFNSAVVCAKVRNHLELKAYRDRLEDMVYDRTKLLEERTRQLHERTVELAASREAIIMGMSLMSESHDRITGAHIARIKLFVNILANKIAERYPGILTDDEINLITLYSPLHDVGKVGIPDNILHKTGVLTPEEREVMKSHTLKGAELLSKTERFLIHDEKKDLNVAIEIAENHHERYDGTGYPHGLSGDNIPISARIVSVTDVYDALRSSRPYKRAFSHDESASIILSGDSSTKPNHFDPKVLECFELVCDEFRRAYGSMSE